MILYPIGSSSARKNDRASTEAAGYGGRWTPLLFLGVPSCRTVASSVPSIRTLSSVPERLRTSSRVALADVDPLHRGRRASAADAAAPLPRVRRGHDVPVNG